jgi:hypothetical protein
VARYRKKPVEVEAIQYTGDNAQEIGRFAGLDASVMGRERALVIHSLEGTMHVSTGDYVIRGVSGEHYPCKPDIFHKTYDPVED